MKFAQIFLPAILFAICKSQAYENRDYDEPINMANNIFKHLEAQQKSEQLIEQYRFLIAKSLLRLKDACKVYDFLMGVDQKWFEEGEKEQIPIETQSSDTEQYIRSLLQLLKESKNPDFFSNFSKQNNINPATNVLFYFVTTSTLLKDSHLDQLLRVMLQEQCSHRPSTDGEVTENKSEMLMDKRTGPKKARFHSWGGKRSNRTPKIVIRTPFHSWGGKRSSRRSSPMDFMSSIDK